MVPFSIIFVGEFCVTIYSSDFGNSECSIFGIKTTVLLASAVQ